jgi:hypothetical protein
MMQDDMDLPVICLLCACVQAEDEAVLLQLGLGCKAACCVMAMMCDDWGLQSHVVCVLCVQAEDEAVLLRLGLAVMSALQQGLLELDDFEALITHLKVRGKYLCPQVYVLTAVVRCGAFVMHLQVRPVVQFSWISRGCRSVVNHRGLHIAGYADSAAVCVARASPCSCVVYFLYNARICGLLAGQAPLLANAHAPQGAQ